MDVAKVKWTGGRQFIGIDEAGHSVVMDASAAYGGEGTGIRPIELLLHAVAGCTAMDVVSILEKKRQEFSGLRIEVSATQREDEFPKIYTDINVEYVVEGDAVDPKAVQRAIELSEDKYCSVKGMIGPQVRMSSSFRIEEPPPRAKRPPAGER